MACSFLAAFSAMPDCGHVFVIYPFPFSLLTCFFGDFSFHADVRGFLFCLFIGNIGECPSCRQFFESFLVVFGGGSA